MKTEFLNFLINQGYEEVNERNGSVVCICRFAFTWGILAELTMVGYERRWCYPTKQEALDALEEWMCNDEEEPGNWLRRTHIHDKYPVGFDPKVDRMSDVIKNETKVDKYIR